MPLNPGCALEQIPYTAHTSISHYALSLRFHDSILIEFIKAVCLNAFVAVGTRKTVTGTFILYHHCRQDIMYFRFVLSIVKFCTDVSF